MARFLMDVWGRTHFRRVDVGDRKEGFSSHGWTSNVRARAHSGKNGPFAFRIASRILAVG